MKLTLAPIARYTKPRNLMRLSLLALSSFSLSGCLLTSPFWGQTYESRDDTVVLQSYVTNRSQPVIFECSPAYHGGLYPPLSTPTWTSFATVNPSSYPMYDSDELEAFSVSTTRTLPDACWHYDGASSKYMSAIRARRSGTTSNFKVFDEAGLACVGKAIGETGSWAGWINQDCTKTYSNSSQEIPYVKIFAES